MSADFLSGVFGGADPLKAAADRARRDRARKAAQTSEIRGKTIDGTLYVRALDVAVALRTEGLDDSVVLRRLRSYLGKTK